MKAILFIGGMVKKLRRVIFVKVLPRITDHVLFNLSKRSN